MKSIQQIQGNHTLLGKQENDIDYANYLRTFGLEPKLRGPWASVGSVARIQGWKLHISTIPGEVLPLLNLIIPCVLQLKIPSFKIARGFMTLGYLNEGELGRTQVGKFMTIYPQDDESACRLAKELVQLTQGMHGPRIISDMQLGDIVFTRYGSFNPIIKRDRLGLIRQMIYAPDNSLKLDEYQVPFYPPEGVENPFKNWHLELTQDDNAFPYPIHMVDGKPTKLFGPGYLFLEPLRMQPKGGVFKVLDLRCQESIELKILKQGKQFCMSDAYDRDMRTRLQHQAKIHQELAAHCFIPSAGDYFEVEGDGYLPIAWIEGKSIETFAVQMLEKSSFGSLALEKRVILLEWCQKLLQTVAHLHAKGYVHRDLTASNVWLGEDEQLYLLDLELCHALNDPSPAFGLGTAGFMSPQQANREPPSIADDIYAIGCLFILILTGIDPRRLVRNNEADLLKCLMEITQSAPLALLEVTVRCTNTVPQKRPSLDVISTILAQSLDDLKQKKTPQTSKQKQSYLTGDEIVSILTRGTQSLFRKDVIQSDDGLWLSLAIENGAQHHIKQRYAQQFELRQSANRGIAGVVYGLSRLAHFGFLPPEGKDRVSQAINWLVSEPQTVDAGLPGLHFGSAGLAVALTEAINAGLQPANDAILNVIQTSLIKPVDWPDMTHGAAGQGIASFYCFDSLGLSFLLNNVAQCVDYLVSNQQEDGSWVMPEGVPGMSGEILSGFAHGVAGIVYFLAEFASRNNDNRVWESALRALNWLQNQATIEQVDGNELLTWPYSNQNQSRWHWWCHGGPGIALTFIRLYELTGEKTYAELTCQTLKIHPINLRYPNLSQCHGLSGLGDIYLEAYRVLGDEEWLERAQALAKFLYAMRQTTEDGDLYWLVEDPHLATADLMVGNSGVLHFYLRLLHEGKQPGLPLLLSKRQ